MLEVAAPVQRLHLGTARGRWVLLATVLGSGMAQLDGTVVNVALPRIGHDCRRHLRPAMDHDRVHVDAGGVSAPRRRARRSLRAAQDLHHRRHLVRDRRARCAPSRPTPDLNLARALQGVGGALLTPGSLAILQTSFPPEDRGRAIGAWTGLGGVAGAVGPFVGGWLLNVSSWRWIFVLNLPLAVGVLAGEQPARAREPGCGRRRGRPDWAGGIIAAASLAALTYGLIEGPAQRWKPAAVGRPRRRRRTVWRDSCCWNRGGAPPCCRSACSGRASSSRPTRSRSPCTERSARSCSSLPVQLQTVAGLHAVRVGRLATAIDGAHAAAVGPVGCAGRPDRTASADVRRPAAVSPPGCCCSSRSARGFVSDVLPAAFVVGMGLSTTVAPLTAAALSTVPPGKRGDRVRSQQRRRAHRRIAGGGHPARALGDPR